MDATTMDASSLLNNYNPSSTLLARGEPSTSRLQRAPSSYHHAKPNFFLSDPSPETVLPLLQHSAEQSAGSSNARSALVLRHALWWAVEHGDSELVSWLASLPGEWGEILNTEIATMEDEEGWGLVGMAVQSSCGRPDKEDVVRAVVAKWGLETGPRGGRDRAGWTPLHLAGLISTPPLVSFLLNRGASPLALTTRGLTPFDLIAGMKDREALAVILDPTSFDSTFSTSGSGLGLTDAQQPGQAPGSSLSASRRGMLERRRQQATRKAELAERSAAKRRLAQEREKLIREASKIIGVEAELLIPTRTKVRESSDSGIAWLNGDDESETEDEDDPETMNYEDPNSALLVFSLASLPNLLDALITTYKPQCFPLAKRAMPANALYLYARFAHYKCDESWLEELLEGAVEKIESGVYNNVEDLAYLAFWAYNTTLLLYLVCLDEPLRLACEELNLLGMMEELINAIHVFIIRVAERKIDTVLDAAILDYETLEDFDDVRFEGEWTLFRSFGTAKKKREMPKSSAVFAEHNGMTDNLAVGDASGSGGLAPSPSLLGSLRDNIKAKSPLRAIGRPSSMQDLRGAAKAAKAASQEVIADGLASAQAALGRGVEPRKVTNILSSVLLVLQLYEVNPAFVVQVFSQAFFWISCEIFNRILTRKKYLCRSKAVQIRMNITAIEDWTRSNGLPPRIASRHLEPVMQLLQWLQCSSQVKDFDTLIGTMQSLKAINPLQMRRAVRDYRFEVNEGRMSEECIQYLAQLQKDWERRRIQMSAQAMNPEGGVNGQPGSGTTPGGTPDPSDSSTPVDGLFDGSVALADFVPQTAPECLGELLDSRFMLPFLLPAETEYLIAAPAPEAAYANLVPESPFLGDGNSQNSRPSSRSSFSSTRPMEWALPSPLKLRHLPDDFFPFLKKIQMNRRLDWDVLRAKRDTAEAAQRAADAADAATPTATEKSAAPFDTAKRPSLARERSINGTVITSPLPPLSEDDVETTPTSAMFYQTSMEQQQQQHPFANPASPSMRARPTQPFPQALISSPKPYPESQLPSTHPFARTTSPFASQPPTMAPPLLPPQLRSMSSSQASSMHSLSQPSTPARSTPMQSGPPSPSLRSMQSYGQLQSDPRRISTMSYSSASSSYPEPSFRPSSDNVDTRLRGAVNSLYMPNTNSSTGSGFEVTRVVSPSTPPGAMHYELARHRRDRQNSMSSVSTGSQNQQPAPPPLASYTYSTSSGGIGGGLNSPPMTSPKSPASSTSSEKEKKMWWKVNRKTSSSGSGSSDEAQRRRRMTGERDGSESTIVPGYVSYEEGRRAQGATTPNSSRGVKF